MERRADLKRAQAERVAEADAREREKAQEQEDRDGNKAQFAARLEAWSTEPSGAKQPIRVLLANLQNVLWEGAKWEPVPMAKLVIAARVKVYFMRAITLVHPDKHNAMDSAQKYIATVIFHSLEAQWRAFQVRDGGLRGERGRAIAGRGERKPAVSSCLIPATPLASDPLRRTRR